MTHNKLHEQDDPVWSGLDYNLIPDVLVDELARNWMAGFGLSPLESSPRYTETKQILMMN